MWAMAGHACDLDLPTCSVAHKATETVAYCADLGSCSGAKLNSSLPLPLRREPLRSDIVRVLVNKYPCPQRMASSGLAKDILDRNDKQSSCKLKRLFRGHRTHPGTPSEADTSSVRIAASKRMVCLGPEPKLQRGT